MENRQDQQPPEEPSVWDYFVSKLQFWTRDQPAEVSETVSQEEAVETGPETPPIAVSGGSVQMSDPGEGHLAAEPKTRKTCFPWFSLSAVGLALVAQLSLEPSPGRTPWPGIILYGFTMICLLAAIFRREWHLPSYSPDAPDALRIAFRMEFLVISLILAILSFTLFGNGRFQFLNTTLWALSIFLIFLAFWDGRESKPLNIRKGWQMFNKEGLRVRITRWTLMVLAVMAVVLFFNFYRLDSVPPEMVSDQAEKLLDINDILHGHTPVYFVRNTGREVLHFYFTAAYMAIFNLDVSFLNLKAVAVFANLVTLVFVYFLGKELGNRRVGLLAVFFAGIAYWPLLFTRLALRIPYYPLFVAPVMYFLVRGLRRQNINDILWTGFFLGLGLHGYTPFRIVPIFVVLAFLIYILHKPAKNKRLQAVFSLILIVVVSVIVFIPLMRYALANPQMFSYRAFSRLTGMEAGFQEPASIIFLKNFWKASVMFFWDNGVIWAHSIPGRPALEVVSGAFYFIGIISLLVRYIRRRNWIDLFLLVSIPLMLMPSILSLAYPGENPSLNRTAGAVVPVFVVAALAFETMLRTIRSCVSGRIGKILLWVVVLVMLVWSGANNFDLVFDQYYTIYRASSWNTAELGRIAAFFAESLGSPETIYVVGYPHWVDSRLVAINSGYPGRDYAIFPEHIPATTADPRSKLFFLNVNDGENMQLLLETYPAGVLWQFDAEVENKDFMIFFVPPAQGATP